MMIKTNLMTICGFHIKLKVNFTSMVYNLNAAIKASMISITGTKAGRETITILSVYQASEFQS